MATFHGAGRSLTDLVLGPSFHWHAPTNTDHCKILSTKYFILFIGVKARLCKSSSFFFSMFMFASKQTIVKEKGWRNHLFHFVRLFEGSKGENVASLRG